MQGCVLFLQYLLLIGVKSAKNKGFSCIFIIFANKLFSVIIFNLLPNVSDIKNKVY